MKSTPTQPLSRYLSDPTRTGRPANPSQYIGKGAALVTLADLAGLLRLLPRVRKKARAVGDSDRLRMRIELLARFLEETATQGGTPERREVAFVLYYFLKGYDLIPDSIPQIGLLDDALLVDTALNRNQSALRAHWVAAGREYPENL